MINIPSIAQLEGLVSRAIRLARSGGGKEDDRVEFKREWPTPDRSRQLAAAANKAAGELLFWVIGYDEGSGEVVKLDHTDPANWWPQMQKRFSQKSPVLARHTVVYLDDDESVVALVFTTDEVPYVVKIGDYLEVPTREGSRTRSARRNELIDMVAPNAGASR